jgi:hypothetical protein
MNISAKRAAACRVEAELANLSSLLHSHIPCGDSSCAFGLTTGMATNGGCACFKDARNEAQRRVSITELQRLVGKLALELEIRREGEP